MKYNVKEIEFEFCLDYAKLFELNSENFLPAVMNLGPQPTVDPNAPSATEVHILNKQLNLEGKELIIEPIKKIRTQKKFASLEDLSNQIKLDAEIAISILS